MSMGDYYKALALRRDKGTLPPPTSATEGPIKIEDDEDEGSKVGLPAIVDAEASHVPGETQVEEDAAAHVPEETQVEEGAAQVESETQAGEVTPPYGIGETQAGEEESHVEGGTQAAMEQGATGDNQFLGNIFAAKIKELQERSLEEQASAADCRMDKSFRSGFKHL
jgi:hypothetical protein